MTEAAIPSGRFLIPTAEPAGRWWWSDGLFALHGMEAGAVVPTQAVFLSHVHPDDRATVLSSLGHAYARDTDELHSCEYRLCALEGEERTVILSVTGDDSRTGAVSGSVVDVTRERHRAVAEGVNAQLRLALEAHAAIDQAKGILMLALGMDSVDAFALLRACSQRMNTRIRTLAERLVAVSASSDAGDHSRLIDVLVSMLHGDQADPLRTISTDGFALTADRFGTAPLLRITGRMDVAHAIRLAVAVRLVQLDAGAEGIVIDLGALEVTDAPVLAILAEAAQASAGARSPVVVLGADALKVAGDRHRSNHA